MDWKPFLLRYSLMVLGTAFFLAFVASNEGSVVLRQDGILNLVTLLSGMVVPFCLLTLALGFVSWGGSWLIKRLLEDSSEKPSYKSHVLTVTLIATISIIIGGVAEMRGLI
jgi:hypothetical protein